MATPVRTTVVVVIPPQATNTFSHTQKKSERYYSHMQLDILDLYGLALSP